jgi:hypothetical protein
MLDKPDFVGSYDVGEYVYFFFREMSVEFMNCGKTVYSRVARVCKRDTGGKNILNQVKRSFTYYFNLHDTHSYTEIQKLSVICL